MQQNSWVWDKQQQYSQVQGQCLFCQKDTDKNLPILIRKALDKKYVKVQNWFIILIQKLMGPTDDSKDKFNYYDSDYIKYRQCQIRSETIELLKREYMKQQYEYKLGIYTQFYRLYSDFPRFHHLSLQKIIQNHRNSKRKNQYIAELGSSNSSKTDSSSQNYKSKYSTFLSTLDNYNQVNQESILWQDIITEINKLPFNKIQKSSPIKGTFYFNQQQFQTFIKRSEIKNKQRLKKKKKKPMNKIETRQINVVKKIEENKVNTQRKKNKNNHFFFNKLQIRNSAFYFHHFQPNKQIMNQSINHKDSTTSNTPYYNFLKKKINLFESSINESPKNILKIESSVKPNSMSKSKQKNKKKKSVLILKNRSDKKITFEEHLEKISKQQFGEIKIPTLRIRSLSNKRLNEQKFKQMSKNQNVNEIFQKKLCRQRL